MPFVVRSWNTCRVALRTTAELDAYVGALRAAPTSIGALELLVRRPMVNEREILDEGQLDLDPARLIFIDETWASTAMARLRGRAPSGARLRAGTNCGSCLSEIRALLAERDQKESPSPPRQVARLADTV